MTCNKCGKELADGTKTCSKCGATQGAAAEATPAEKPERSPKSWGITILLCLILGPFGAHRFYVGRKVSGFFHLFTLGMFGLWTVFDLVAIILKGFQDRDGLPVKPAPPVKPKPIEPNLALFAALKRDKAIFCQECGAKIEVGVSSCPKCGWKTQDDDNVKNSDQYKEALEMAKEVDRLKPDLNSGKKGGLLVIGLAMAIALSVIGGQHGSSWVLPVFVVLWMAIAFIGFKAYQTHAAARLLFEEGTDMEKVRTSTKTAILWGNLLLVGIVLSVAVPAIVGLFVIASVYGWGIVIVVYVLLSFVGWLMSTGLV